MDTFRRYSGEIPHMLCSLENNYLAVGYKSETGKLGKLIRIINADTGGLFLILRGHTTDVLAIANLEYQTLASGSVDATIKIWRWKKGDLFLNLTGHSQPVLGLVSLFVDKHLASCSQDSTIKIWNVEKKILIKTIENPSKRSLSLLIALNNGQSIASISADKEINLWNLKNDDKLVESFTGHKDIIISLVKINDSFLASGSFDRKIKLWNIQSGRERQTLSGHSSSVRSLALLRDGNLASASDDNTIRIWDLGQKEANLMLTLFGHTNSALCLAVLTDGNLVSGSRDETINKWHFSSSKNNSNYRRHHSEGELVDIFLNYNGVYALASLNDHLVASKGYHLGNPSLASVVHILNIKTKDPICKFEVGLLRTGFNILLKLKQNDLLACASEQNIVILNYTTCGLYKKLNGYFFEDVYNMASLSEQTLASSTKSGGKIYIWNITNAKIIKTLTAFSVSQTISLELFSSDCLAGGYYRGEVVLWNLTTYRVVKTFFDRSHRIKTLILLNNSKFACGLGDGSIAIWNRNSGLQSKSLKVESTEVTSLVLLRNGLLASSHKDEAAIRIWNYVTAQLVQTLFEPSQIGQTLFGTEPTQIVYSICLMNNGYLIGGSVNLIRVWFFENKPFQNISMTEIK
jgi:WD40 repeat protein